MIRWSIDRYRDRCACLALVLLILSGAETAMAQSSDSALRSYYAGNGFLNRGMYNQAAEEYRKFLAEHATHEKAAVARYGLGVSLFRMQQHQEAIRELEPVTADQSFPYAAEVWMIVGQCHLASKDYPQAVQTFEQLLARHPDHQLVDDALAIQAEALYRAGDHDRVAGPAGILVVQFPDSDQRERAELFWGMAEMAQGKHRDAADRFQGMVARFPSGKFADRTDLMLAQSLHRSDAGDQAAGQYEKIITSMNSPFVPDALYGLALLLQQQGQPNPAGPLLDQLLEQHPQHKLAAESRLLRGRVWFDQDQFDRAAESFQMLAVQPGPQQDDAEYWLAKCELRQDRPGAAAERLQQAILTHQDSELIEEMVYDQGVALLRSDQPGEAMAVLMGFRQQFPDHALAPDALQLMAVTEHQQGNYQESQQLCRQFLTEEGGHPGAAVVKFLTAENEFLPRQYAAAAEEYRQFLAEFPDDSQVDKAKYRLGMSLYHLGELEEAETVLAEILNGGQTESSFRAALLALGDGYFQRDNWAFAERYFSDYVAGGLEQPSADDAQLKLGLALHRQGRFDEAIAAYDRFIDSFPASEHLQQVVFERGQALVSLDRKEEAVLAFEQVLAMGADSRFVPHALNHLGAISMQAGDFDSAAQRFATVTGAEPDGRLVAEALYQQGQALMAAERWAEAADAFGALVQDHPDAERVNSAAALQAIAVARDGRHEEALVKIDQVNREYLSGLDTSMVVAVIYEKAWCERGLQRPEDAALSYRSLLEQPGTSSLHQFAMLELAELEADVDNYEEASTLLALLKQTADGSTPRRLMEQASYRHGAAQFHLDNYAEAATLLAEFIDTYPGSEHVPSASLLCGDALFKAGRHHDAKTHLQRVADRFPDDQAYGPALLRLGETLAVIQEFRESEAVFDKHLQALPDSPLRYQAEFGVAWARENQGSLDGAIEAYQKVVEHHQGETAARAQFQIGECLYAQKRYEEAARELVKVDILYAYPKWSAGALYEAGRCFQELSNPVDARKQFEKVVTEYGESEWAPMAAQRLEELMESNLPGQ